MANTVSLEITGEDRTGAAWADAGAKAQAFGRVVNATLRKEISASGDAARAEGTHAAAVKLLAEAEDRLAENADDAAAAMGREARAAEVAAAKEKLAAARDAKMVRDAQNLGKDTTGGGGGGKPAWLMWAGGLAGLAPLITGIGGAFAGAAAGIAAFGAVAGPVIKNAVSATSSLVAANSVFDSSAKLVHTAITTNATDAKTAAAATVGLTGAQKQVMSLLGQQGTRWQGLSTAQRNAAVSLDQNKAALKAMLPDQATALRQLIAQGQAYDQLTPAQRAFGQGLSTLRAGWAKLQSAITPALLRIAAETMKQLGTTLQLVGQTAKLAAPGIGHLVGLLMGLVNNVFRALEPAVKPGLAVINELVTVLSGSLLGVLKMLVTALTENQGTISSFFGLLGSVLSGLTSILGALAKALGPVVGALAGQLTVVVRALAPVLVQVAVALGSWLRALIPLLPALAKLIVATLPAITVFAKLMVQIAPLIGLLSKLAAWLITIVAIPVVKFFNAVQTAITAVLGWLAQLVTGWQHDLDAIRHMAASWGHDIASVFDQVRHTIASVFDQIRHDIAAWAASLPGLLVKAGENLISGLISGITNSIPGLHSVLSWVSGLIPSWKGPLDKDRQMLFPHGQAIMDGLMGGISSRVPDLRSQLTGVGGVISGMPAPAGRGRAAPGGQAAPLVLQLAGGGTGLDHLFMTWLANAIRGSGGDPRILTTKVSALA